MEYIYVIRNNKTHRYYVGRSHHNVEYRIGQHMNELKGNRHKNRLMQKDFNEHGENSFRTYYVPFNKNLTRRYIEGNTMLLLQTYKEECGYNYKDQFLFTRYGKPTRNVIEHEKQGKLRNMFAKYLVLFLLICPFTKLSGDTLEKIIKKYCVELKRI